MEIRGQGAQRQPRDIFELIGRKEQIERTARAMRAIVEAVGTSQSNVSQHLAILREKRILSPRKNANRVYYSVSDQRTLHLIATMREVLCGSPPRS
jgi:ArsR family transcriptional regulator